MTTRLPVRDTSAPGELEAQARQAEAARAGSSYPIRIGFVVHVMQVAGAEVLVAETIRRLGKNLEPVIFCLDSIGEFGERLKAEGVPVVSFGRRPGLDLSVSRRMAASIRERDLQVIHAHQYTPFFYSGLAAVLARRGTGVIFTEHGRHWPDVVSRKRQLLNRLVLRHLADRITGVCEFSVRALYERDGFPRDRISVIENGIDLGRYASQPSRSTARARLGLDPNRRLVSCIARFHPVKDHKTLVEAFARIATSRPDVDLLLVGDGPLRSQLEAQVRTLNLWDRVFFLGVRQDVPDLLAASDLFALSSVSEAASITLLEAMATGLPVVVTKVGGNPEIVREGVDGRLTPRGDVESMATAMAYILDNPDTAGAMGKAGASRVHDCFRLEQTIDRYHALYRQIALRTNFSK